MPPSTDLIASLRRQKIRRCLPTHEAEGKNGDVGGFLSIGGLENGRFVHSDLFLTSAPDGQRYGSVQTPRLLP